MQIVEPRATIIYPNHFTEVKKQLSIIEYMYRLCYGSIDKITDNSYKEFIKARIKQGHESILGFGIMIVEFTTDRGVANELVRHRIATYAQESTRYCMYKDGIKVICPPEIKGDPDALAFWKQSCLKSEYTYKTLIKDQGYRPEIARGILPIDLATTIGMKANFQEWRHVFKLRTSKQAHPAMRRAMISLLNKAKETIPVVFDDIEVEE